MFAKIVICVALVSILPCESQHNQQFVEIPFENFQTSTNANHAFGGSPLNSGISNNQAFFNDQAFQGNLHGQLTRNNHINAQPIVSPPKQQFISGGFPESPAQGGSFHDGNFASTSRGRAQPARTSPVRIAKRRRPVTTTPSPLSAVQDFQTHDFAAQQPAHTFNFEQSIPQRPRNKLTEVTVIMPVSVSPVGHNQFSATPSHGLFVPNVDHDFLSSVAQPKQTHRTTSQFVGVEEPAFRFSGQETHKPQEFAGTASFLSRAQPAAVPQFQPTFHSRPLQAAPPVTQAPLFSQQPQFLINVQPEPTPTPQAFPSRNAIHRASPAQHTSPKVFNTQQQKDEELEELLARQQAESAQYSFASQIDDNISGNQHQREEVRDGLAVKGMYSYSDGYVKRTVHYEADENGYRVVKQEEEPLGDGPHADPNGQADVSTYVGGNTVQYSITAADIQDPKPLDSKLASRRF